jgi:hypothetical protein
MLRWERATCLFHLSRFRLSQLQICGRRGVARSEVPVGLSVISINTTHPLTRSIHYS